MRKMMFLILAMISVNVFGGDMDENVSVKQNGEEYIVRYFNYKQDTADYFSKIGLQGSGYTWEALVKAGVETEAPELLPQLDFSPEGGTFIAYTASEDAANKVKSIIEKFSVNMDYRNALIKVATDGGYIE